MHPKQLTRQRRVFSLALWASVLFMLPLTAARAMQVSGGSPIYSIEGEHRVFIDGDTISPGGMSVAPSQDGDEGLAITASPWGTGTLEQVGAAWLASCSSGATVSFVYDYASGRYEFEIVDDGTTGFLLAGSSTVEILGPQDPQGQGPKGSIGSNGPGRIDIEVIWPPWLQPYIQSIKFYQLVTVHVWALRRPVPGVPPTTEDLPPGIKLNGSTNGGVNPSYPDVMLGAGTFTVDGSTTYVDSGHSGVPDYVGGGGQGTTDPGKCSMTDTPGFPASAFAMAIAGMNNPGEIVGVRVECVFSTYLVVNGLVIWKWNWIWRRDILFNQISPAATVQWFQGSSVTALSPSDAAAMNDFMNGKFNGAPAH